MKASYCACMAEHGGDQRAFVVTPEWPRLESLRLGDVVFYCGKHVTTCDNTFFDGATELLGPDLEAAIVVRALVGETHAGENLI